MSELIRPAFEGCDNCIVFSSNEGFAPAAAVAIRSIAESGKSDEKYDIILLHTDIKKTVSDKLRETIKDYDNVSLRLVDVSRYAAHKRFYTRNRNTLTKEAYYRLFIPYILDEKYSKALYFDADMIFYRDVNELFDIDLDGALIAAVRDYWGICNCYMPWDGRREYREGIGLPDIDEYVISATILFDLEAFRKTYELSEVIKTAGRRKWLQHDQDVINVLCKGRIKHLSPEWGMLTDYGNNHYLPNYLKDELYEGQKNIAVFHFAAYRKPWRGQYGEDHMNFWKMAARTSFFDELLSYIDSPEQLNQVIYYLKDDPDMSDVDLTIDERSDETDMIHPAGRYFHDIYLGGYGSGHARYRIIREENGVLHLEGMLGFFGVKKDAKVKVYLLINGERTAVLSQKDEDCYDDKYGTFRYRSVIFATDIETEELISNGRTEILISCDVDGREALKDQLGFERYAPLVRELDYSYSPLDELIVSTDRTKLIVYRNTFFRRFLFERRLITSNCFVSSKPYLRAILVRKAAHILRAFKRKPIWLVNDRVMKADDNGEAVFCFLNKEEYKDKRDVYFVLDKRSPDHERISSIGKVVEPASKEHKFLLTRADVIISSQTDQIFRCPFLWHGRLYRDMIANVKFVFLQHGVLLNDGSGWLKKKNQEIRGLVTSAGVEYDGIVNGDYGYKKDEIWLTGLPRFDRLKDAPEKIISVMPTWRMYLSRGQNTETGIWEVIPDFQKSKYVSFYRSLANDERLNESLKKNGYKLRFRIHPSFATHESDFGIEEDMWWDEKTSYREIYEKSSLMITDYSSSVSDLIYMNKPVLYCQFDKEEFFSGEHITGKSSFDYEKEGFGEVTYDLDSAVDCIISYMETGCKLKEVYKKRIDDFFAHHDKNNCKRIYEKICELTGEEQ